MDRVELRILYRDGDVSKLRCIVNKWKFQDAMMGEQYLTFTITSEKPIDWAVGDFCQFRGETYTLNYVPSVTQKAGNKEKQDTYTYENVKFESYQEELTRCLMLDITPTTGEYVSALGTNYTGSSKFTLFCGETSANGTTLTAVCALAAKMQANLDRMYHENGWKVFVDTTSTYITGSGSVVLVTHTEDKALTFDNTSVAQALAEVHNTFDLDYCIRGRNIYIGYNLKNLTSDNAEETFAFGYGKGYASHDNQNKALFQIKRVANSQQMVVTRLRALGSTKNMPYRFYNKKYNLSQSLFPTNLQLPDTFATPAVKALHNAQRDQSLSHVKGDTNDSYIDKNNDAESCKEGIRETSVRFDGSNADLPEIYPTIEDATYGELRGALVPDQDGVSGYGSFPGYGDSEAINKILAVGYLDHGNLVNDANKEDGILPESGISTTGISRAATIGMTYLNYNAKNHGNFTYNGTSYLGDEKTLFRIQGVAPGSYAMAPTIGAVIFGFSMSCYRDGCSCDVGYIITIKARNVQTDITTTIATYNSDFIDISRSDGIKEMELPELPDVKKQNPKVQQILVTALSDITVTFTPVIRNVSVPSGFTDNFSINYQVANSRRSNEVTAEPEYTWFPVADSDTLTDTFHVFVQDMGFEFEACWSDETPMMVMKSGRCVGREFEIGSSIEKVEYGGKKGYMLTLKRAEDSSLNTYYPSETDPIAAGDQFVLLGIQMPDVYVQMAEVRLLRAATDFLADNCETKFTYQPSIDDIYLQRNLDMMRKEHRESDSIFWRLYAGLKFTFRGIPANETDPVPLAEITIEKVTISMGEGLTPKVELTLNDDVQQGTIQKLTTSVDRIYNGSIFSSGSGGSVVGAAILSILQSEGDKLFVSKVHDDTVAGKITFEDTVTHNELLKARKGMTVGRFQSGLLGNGALIDEDGNAEFNSIFSRNFISTPEFRFNRVNVTEGENWCTNGFGTILNVEIIDDTTGYIDLKLEENDYSSIQVGDICRGIYNDIAHQYETKTLDDDSELYDEEEEGEGEENESNEEQTVEVKTFGFSSKEGFFTSYFWVRQFITNKKGECRFLYELRNAKTPHPCEFMKFAQYGSFTNVERRSSSYSTSIGHYYEMVLDGVSTWKIMSANVVYRKGYLGNMFVTLKNGKEAQLQGYGLYVQDNVYFGNAVVQLDPETLKDLENQLKSYVIDFSEYVNVITVDDVGNVIGGLYTVSGSPGRQYREYRIQSAITVRNNDKLLVIAEDGADAGEGTYKVYLQPKGCTCMMENSTLYITSIDHIKDGIAGTEDDENFDYDAMRTMSECSVDIIIDCEGKGSITKSFPIRIKHDSQPYVGADLDNEFSAVSWNTKLQRYIGLPIEVNLNMWHNNEFLDVTSVAVNGIIGATSAQQEKDIVVNGVTLHTALVKEVNYIARITIDALPEDFPAVTNFNITATANYSGVSYERTFKHTLHRSVDTNVYSLMPSVPEVITNKNQNAAQELSEEYVSCKVWCNSSDDNRYEVSSANFATHHIALYKQIFFVDGTHTEETPYTGAVEVDTSVSEIRFILYGLDSNGVLDKTLIHDSEGVPVLAVGVDGKGVEYIFFLQSEETPLPTIYEEPDKLQNDDYCPYTDEYKTKQWTDNPSGVSEEYKYEYYSMRKKIGGVWTSFGEVKEWNRYTVSPYTVEFSDHVDVITVDDVGNVIGGLYTVSGANNEHRSYRIHSAISVRLGQELLTIDTSNSVKASEGYYKLYVQPRGCSCVLEDSTLFITGIDNIKDGAAGSQDDVNFDYNAMRQMESCSVDIIIDCEGKKTLVKSFPITIKHDSQPFVGADIDNEFSAVSWNTKTQSYIGLPIGFDMKMWHNDKFLNIENANNISLTTSTSGVTLVNGTAPATPAATSIYYTKTIETITKNAGAANEYSYKVARIRITALGINVPLVTDISVTTSAVYAGVTYERTLVHTINKSTDTNVYSLLPTLNEIVLDKNTNTLSSNSVNCDVICDSSDDKHYTVAYADFATHGIVMYYKKFYIDGTSDQNETLYENSAVTINSSVSEIKFYLYGKTNGSVNRNIVHDTEGVPVISGGENTIQLIIDNANDSVMCLEDGTVIASTLPFAKVFLNDGNDMVNTSLAASAWQTLECEGCTATWVNGYDATDGGKRFNVTAVTDDVAKVIAKVIYKETLYKVVHNIKKLYGLDKYEIVTDPVSIAYNPNTGAHTPTSFKVYVYLTTQEEDRHLMTSLPGNPDSPTDGTVRLQYSVNDGSSWTNLTGYSSGKTVQNSVFSSIASGSVLLRVQKYVVGESGGEWIILDEEGVEVISGGENSTSYWFEAEVNAIPLDEDGTQKFSSFSVYLMKKKGDDAAVRCSDFYLAVYRLSGSTYTRAQYLTSKASGISVVVASDKTITQYIVCAFTSTAPATYGDATPVAELGIGVTVDGEPGENYYLTSDINSIIKDAAGNFKGSARPTITAWKKVGENVAVRLADLVDGSGIVAEGMTIKAYEMNGNTVAYTNTSTTGVLTCATPYTYVDRFEVELVKGTTTYATLSIPILQEVQGSSGEAGVYPRDRGYYKSGETYYYTLQDGIYIRDMVRYEIGGVMYGFLVKTKGTTVTAAPTSASGDSNWDSSGIVETVIANTLFGTNANIGGFMASSQMMQSQNGSLTLDGVKGLIKLLHENGYSWQVLQDGRQVLGIYNNDTDFGEHIELDPISKEIRIYDESGVCTLTMNGREAATLGEIFGNNSGDISLSSYKTSSCAASNGGTQVVDNYSNIIRNLGNFETTSASRIYVSGSIMATGSQYTHNGSSDQMKPGCDNYALVTLKVLTYSNSARTILKKTTQVARVSSLDSSTRYGTKALTLSNTAADLPSGYHTLQVEGYAIVFRNCVGVRSATASWDVTAASYSSDVYLSRLVGNGFAFGTNIWNYFAALNIIQNNVKRMIIKALTEASDYKKYGFLLDNAKGFQVIRPKGTTDAIAGCVFPTILYCYVSWTAGNTYSITTHFSFNGNNASVEKQNIGDDGVMRVNFPTGFSGLNLSLSNCIASVTAVTTNCRNAHIYRFSSTYIDVECNDDTSNNYASFILELRYIG